MTILTNQSGQSIVLAQELGRGGEGAVFALANRNELVAKVYHPEQRTAQRAAKLAVMVSNPPVNLKSSERSHPSLAWPCDLLYERDQFVGFVMPRIDRCPNIFELYNPKLRTTRYPRVDRRFLHHVAKNLAIVLAGLHASGYTMGDVNQKNILVNPQALVTLVDTDSFQVADREGKVYRCGVGVPEYTPPELQGKVLAQVDRQPMHDCFGMSVLLFQLLMEGYHPFTGRPISTNTRQVSQLSLHCIQWGIFPYQANQDVQPPPAAPNFAWLHPELQQLFIQTFLLGHLHPENRPNALAWVNTLGMAEELLGRCGRNPSHLYSRHLDRCPYCAKMRQVSVQTRMARNQGWQPRQAANSTASAGTWWELLLALCLPALVIVGIPLLIWLVQAGWIGLLPVIFGILARLKLLKHVGRGLQILANYSIGGVKIVYHYWDVRVAPNMKVVIGVSTVAGLFLAMVIIKGVSTTPEALSKVSSEPSATQEWQVVSPLSPLTLPSPLATPGK